MLVFSSYDNISCSLLQEKGLLEDPFKEEFHWLQKMVIAKEAVRSSKPSDLPTEAVDGTLDSASTIWVNNS
ncbi:hypothetical protein SLA2020_055180 [Shorea laevis]